MPWRRPPCICSAVKTDSVCIFDGDGGDGGGGDAGGMAMAGFIAGVGFVDCDHILAVTLLTISWAFSGLIGVGPHISALDMSPQHAGCYFLYIFTASCAYSTYHVHLLLLSVL